MLNKIFRNHFITLLHGNEVIKWELSKFVLNNIIECNSIDYKVLPTKLGRKTRKLINSLSFLLNKYIRKPFKNLTFISRENRNILRIFIHCTIYAR